MMTDWQRVGKFWFRVRDIYHSTSSGLPPSDKFLIAACPVLALFAAVEKSTARLYVYTASFKLLAQTDLPILPSLVVGFWWTVPDCAVNLVLSDGQCLSVPLKPSSLFGTKNLTKTLSNIDEVVGVSSRSDRFAVLTRSMRFQLVSPPNSCTHYASLPKDTRPVSFALLDDFSLVVALDSGSLVRVLTQSGHSEEQVLFCTSHPGECVSTLSLSFSGQFLAAYTSRGSIFVFSTADFSVPHCSVNPIECAALDMGDARVAWVGDDCLAVSFKRSTGSLVFLGGLGGDWAPYEYAEEVCLTSDLHCASLLSGRDFKTIARVQSATQKIFHQPDSAVNKLVFGYRKFVENDVQSESTIRSIRDELEAAVTGCVEAAVFETPIGRVVDCGEPLLLLKASVFGRQFMKPQSVPNCSRKFVASVGLFRVCAEMNKQGVPIAVSQLALFPKLVVHYATASGQYLLATRLARWLGLDPSGAAAAWAVELVHTGAHLTDNDLCELIETRGGRNVVPVAEFAYANGRKNLATLLLQSEGPEQVRMLLQLGSEELAIEKAGEDVELVHQCLDQVIAKKIPLPITNNFPLVIALVANRHKAEGKFEDLCKLLQSLPEANLAEASLALAQSKAGGPPPAYASWLQYASQRSGSTLVAGFLAEASELITAQLELEKKFKKKSFVAQSLDDTLAALILSGESVEADSLRLRFKMTQGRFWDLHVQTLMRADRLGEAISFANKVPPPPSDCRGFKTLVCCLVAAKRDDLALPFIRKLKSKQQALFFSQLGLHEEARAASATSGLFGRLTGGFIGNR